MKPDDTHSVLPSRGIEGRRPAARSPTRPHAAAIWRGLVRRPQVIRIRRHKAPRTAVTSPPRASAIARLVSLLCPRMYSGTLEIRDAKEAAPCPEFQCRP